MDTISIFAKNSYEASGNVALLTLDIAKAISKAVKFVSKDKNELRPQFSHICFHIKYDTLTIVATDTQWMYISEPFSLGELKTFKDYKYLVTVQEARSVAQAIRRNKTMYMQTGETKWSAGTFTEPNRHIYLPTLCFCKGDYELFSVRKIEMNYPDYNRAIPEANETFVLPYNMLVVTLQDIMRKLEYDSSKKMSQRIKELGFKVTLYFWENVLTIAIDYGKQCLYSRNLPYKEDSCNHMFNLYFDCEKLLKVVTAIGKNDICITIQGPDKGVSFASEGAQERALLFPMK